MHKSDVPPFKPFLFALLAILFGSSHSFPSDLVFDSGAISCSFSCVNQANLVNKDTSNFGQSGGTPVPGDYWLVSWTSLQTISTVILSMFHTSTSSTFIEGYSVDIYAGQDAAGPGFTNTQCASNVLPEGSFSCPSVSSLYLYIVLNSNPQSRSFELTSLQAYSEQEISNHIVDIIPEPSATFASDAYLQIGETPYTQSNVYFGISGSPASYAIYLDSYVYVTSILLLTNASAQLGVVDGETQVSFTLVNTAPHSTAFILYDYGASLQQLAIQDINGVGSYHIRKLVILGTAPDCVNDPLTPIAMTDMTVMVFQTPLTTQTFSLSLPPCGYPTVSISSGETWITLVEDPTTQTGTITIDANDNALGGQTFTVTMASFLANFSRTVNSVFTVTVNSNPCTDGFNPPLFHDMHTQPFTTPTPTQTLSLELVPCGFGIVTITNPVTYITYSTDGVVGTITAEFNDNSLVNTYVVNLSVTLNDYPGAPPITNYFQVFVTSNPCTDGFNPPLFHDMHVQPFTTPAPTQTLSLDLAPCGFGVVTITNPITYITYSTDGLVGTITADFNDNSLVNTYVVNLSVALNDYPTVPPITNYFQVFVTSNPCTDGTLAPIVVNDMTAMVFDVAPATQLISLDMPPCGPATLSLPDSYPWDLVTPDPNGILQASLTITANDNAYVGVYSTTLSAVLDNYPTWPAINTIFIVSITANGCTDGTLLLDAIPNLTATIGQGAISYSFQTSNAQCGSGIYTLVDEPIWASVVSDPITGQTTIQIESVDPADVGLYTLTMTYLPDLYSTAPLVSTTFQAELVSGCDNGALSTLEIPDMETQVLGEPLVFEITTVTQDCGDAIFTVRDQPEWASIETDPLVKIATLVIEPTLNTQAGEHHLIVDMTLKDYTLAPPVEHLFTVIVHPTINQPPYFSEELITYHMVFKTDEELQWSYSLPLAVDPDFDEVTIKLNLGQTASFVSYEGVTLSIPDLSKKDVIAGNYYITGSLSDGAASTTFLINLVVAQPSGLAIDDETGAGGKEAVSDEQTPQEMAQEATSQNDSSSLKESQDGESTTDEAQEETESDTLVPDDQSFFDWELAFQELEERRKRMIDSNANREPQQPIVTKMEMSNTGAVTIKFSEDMQIIPSLDWITKASVRDKKGVQRPVVEINIDLGYFSDPNRLGYSVKFSKMERRSLHLQIQFKQPLYVSTEEEPEELEVVFNGGNLFISTEGLPLKLPNLRDVSFRRLQQKDDQENNYLLLKMKIPKQLPAEGADLTAIETLNTAATSTKTVIVVNFVLNIVLSASLQQLWSMINTQQMIVLLPLMRVNMPINAAQFFQSIFQIAAFAFYDFNEPTNDMLNLEETEPFNENFGTFGFESRYVINNMGTLLLFYVFYPFFILGQKIISKFKNCSLRLRKLNSKLRDSLYWSVLITGIFESYSIVSLCCLIGLPVIGFESYGQTVQSVVCISFCIFTLTVPYIMIGHAVKHFHILEQSRVKKRIGAIYEDLNLKSGKYALLQPTFFLLRRLILAFTVVTAYKHFISQVYLVWLQGIIALLILEYAKPSKSSSERRMEIFNEVILMGVLYTMMCFTPFVPQIETQMHVGYVACFLVALHFGVSLVLIFRDSYRETKIAFYLKRHLKNQEKTRAKIKERLDAGRPKRKKRRDELRYEHESHSVSIEELIVDSKLFGDGSEVSSQQPSMRLQSCQNSLIQTNIMLKKMTGNQRPLENEQEHSAQTAEIPVPQRRESCQLMVQMPATQKKDIIQQDDEMVRFTDQVNGVLSGRDKLAEPQKASSHMTFVELEKETMKILHDLKTPVKNGQILAFAVEEETKQQENPPQDLLRLTKRQQIAVQQKSKQSESYDSMDYHDAYRQFDS